MDWIVCDDFSIQVAQFLALADWASRYCWARKIPDLKSETVKKILDCFNNDYSGPPLHLTSDGGTNLDCADVTAW